MPSGLRRAGSLLATAFDWGVRLIPAAALFSLFFAFEGELRWLGLLGIVPLFLVTRRDCPSCGFRQQSCDASGRDNTWRTWPGH